MTQGLQRVRRSKMESMSLRLQAEEAGVLGSSYEASAQSMNAARENRRSGATE
jgi:hypothetical protein